MQNIQQFHNLEVVIDYNDLVNYVAVFNGEDVCSSLTVRNTGLKTVNNLTVTIGGYYFASVELTIPSIGGKKSVELDADKAIRPSIDRLMALSEAVYTELSISISNKSRELVSYRIPITIQAWNHWRSLPKDYKYTASFSLPNNSYIAEIMSKASRILAEKNPEVSMSGYGVATHEELMAQVGAIWEALTEEKLNYLTMSRDHINFGQKIQTVDMLRQHRTGNCLDMAMLLCSCLERLSLAPLLLFTESHVVVGLWHKPVYVLPEPSPWCTDAVVDGIFGEEPKMLVLEATMMSEKSTVEESGSCALEFLKGNPIDAIVDITAARRGGIRPLPFYGSSAEIVPCEWTDITALQSCMAESSRRNGWERKLLDLSLRNPMLNLHPGKTIVPVWEKNVKEIVVHLKANRLAEIVGTKDEDPTDKLKELYRAARTSLEENGANSLFVAVGTLRWFDVDDDRPHFAPLLFIPAVIVRKKALTYEIRLRDDEPMVNVTLVEMLRQMFGVTFPELDNIPLDEDGFPEWERIFAIFQEQVTEINKRQPDGRKWELPVESYIGIFSFTKYLMWNDIHTHPTVLDRHPVIHGLMDNRYEGGGEPCDARKLEAALPTELMLPIDYDSSQLEAVAEAHAGNSFVLHGPPGTGKSQTITNMIADALFNGKRVLFVAEKKAALDVVRNRLNGIGLSPYCLELHSNKTDKRSFFGQLNDSKIACLGGNGDCGEVPQWKATAETLLRYRNMLDGVTEAIHKARTHGVSLYDSLCRFLATRYHQLELSYEEVCHLSPDEVSILCSELASLDLVAKLIGKHPGDSKLVGLYPLQNTAENQNGITSVLDELPESIARARRKATGWINRWFKRKTVEEILHSDPVWVRLESLANLDQSSVADIDAVERSVNRWKEAVCDLRRWYHFSDKANIISAYGLPTVLDHYLKGNMGAETAQNTESGYYRAIAEEVLNNDSRLRGFSGMLHNDTIGQYVRIVDSFQRQRREALLHGLERSLNNRALTPAQSKQLAVLSRRMLSNGRGVSLRKVIGESESVLQMVFPCMLMSPLSVAQYLEMRPEMFDLVIFDEASQMETPDAIGAIARGGCLVVVGDPKQLPPTRFFTTQSSSGEEVEENEDADSILEDCIALGLPSRYLSRHYRSRHESLIAFSNSNFYENKLLTFPSNNDAECKVRFIDPRGIYDFGKSRTNRIEAEAVVNHIIGLIRDSEKAPSIGVVAFSKAQSNLIEDILNAKLQRNKTLQQKLDDAAEPIFIKNLENVQGDERDIIIFSIGYGPDANGNVSLNFGPLNQSGGERRLNVAVSRAREEMVVFSSLQPYHIPAEDVAAKGVSALRRFLVFAKENTVGAEGARDNVERDSVIETIAERLRAQGLTVRTHIGRSAFKIDLAIVDPDNPECYRLGVIIDGRDYHALPTVRDREITVPAVLRGLGWKLKRIWIIDWLDNPEAVLESLIS